MTESKNIPTGVYCLDVNPYSDQIDPKRYLSSLLDLAYGQTGGQLWNGINKVLNLSNVPHNSFPSGTNMRFIAEQSKGQKRRGKLLLTTSLSDNTIAVSINVEADFDDGKHSGSTFEVGSAKIAPDEALNFFLSYYFMSLGKQTLK